tara:strand:+ start:282 stop:1058 length:777 start_codon:yes stop_codon:yes gene_type:complete
MRFLIDLIEKNDIKNSKILLESMLSDMVTSKFSRNKTSILNIFEQEGGAAEDPEGTIEDPLLQPGNIVSKEYFFKRFTYGDHEILMKKVGMGQNAPTVTYIDGERYEVFTTSKQAEKETVRYIKDGSFDKASAEKKAKEDQAAKAKEDEANAAAKEEEEKANAEKQAAEDEKKKQEEDHEKITESFSKILDSDRPNIITFNNGEEKVITVSEAYDALEILKLLNNENGIEFLQRLSDSITSYQETMDFFLDRIRKGIY